MLSQITAASVGRGTVYYVIHPRGERPVYRYGVVGQAVAAGGSLVAVDATTNAGAAMTAVATIIFLVTKFTGGAWVVVIAVPALTVLFRRIGTYYREVGRELDLGVMPPVPEPADSLVIVALKDVSRLAGDALGTALSMGAQVVAISVAFDDDRPAQLRSEWSRWDPGVPLVVLRSAHHSLAGPVLAYVNSTEVRCSPAGCCAHPPGGAPGVAAPTAGEPARRASRQRVAPTQRRDRGHPALPSPRIAPGKPMTMRGAPWPGKGSPSGLALSTPGPAA